MQDRRPAVVTDPLGLAAISLAAILIAGATLEPRESMITAAMIVLILVSYLLYSVLIARVNAQVSGVICRSFLTVGTSALGAGLVGGLNGVAFEAEFPWVRPASPDTRFVGLGVGLLLFGASVLLWNSFTRPLARAAGAGAALGVSGAFGLVVGVVMQAHWGDRTRTGIRVRSLVVTVSDVELARLPDLPGDSYPLLDNYSISFRYEFEHTRKTGITFYSGFASPWANVEVLEATDSIGTERQALGRAFHTIDIPEQRAGSLSDHLVRGRVTGLASGSRKSGFALGSRESWREEYWVKNLDVGDRVDRLVFRFERTPYRGPVRIEREGKHASRYRLEPREWTTRQLENDVFEVIIADPAVDHSFRIVMELTDDAIAG
ncbi:MAG: hypothetical protein AAFR38_04740 [Planctomycetota bacterium]